MTTKLKIAGFAFAVTFALSSQAFAHAHLKASVPEDKSTVASPTEIDLYFSEAIDLKFSGITLTGPDGKEVNLGGAPMLMEDNKEYMVPVSTKLAPGNYTVKWHNLSTDGHKLDGTYTFNVK